MCLQPIKLLNKTYLRTTKRPFNKKICFYEKRKTYWYI